MVDMTTEQFHETILWNGGVATTEIALKSRNVKEFLSKDNSFDVVITEMFYQDAFMALAHKYNAPLILVTTFGNCMKYNILARNPTQLATVIPEFAIIRHPKSFFGRLKTLYHTLYEQVFWRYIFLRQQESLVKKYLQGLTEPVPSLEELQRNASLILMNSHFSVDTPTAYMPNLIEVGGLHLQENGTPLPDVSKKKWF